jgi:DNA-binding FadR family transcriptional regulator
MSRIADPESLAAAKAAAPKAAERVAGRIRRAVVTGELRDGQSLPPEAKLMVEFGVSRPTVREAIRILESHGLVTVSRGPRGGPRVVRPDAGIVASAAAIALQTRGATFKDLYDVRTLIEPHAARLAAQNRPQAAAQALRRHVEHELASVDDVVGAVRAIADFHDLLLEQCGNGVLATLAIALKDVFEKALLAAQRTMKPTPAADQVATLRYGLRSHMKLVELIAAGEAAAAEAHWAAHMDKAGRIWLRSVGSTRVIDLVD